MFHDLFQHYILWSLNFLWRLSIASQIAFFLGGGGATKSTQFFNQWFTSIHEKLNITEEIQPVRNNASSTFYKVKWLSMGSVKANLVADSVLAL
jgi:hypothetical protein